VHEAIEILARGDTHLPFALPRFGTPCAALRSPAERRQQSYASTVMGEMGSGMMVQAVANPTIAHDHGDEDGEM
jgi:phytanoyl-CoA hydroxylase